MTLRLRFAILSLSLTVPASAYIRSVTTGGTPLTRADSGSIQVLVNGSMKAGQLNADGRAIITASSNPFQAVVNAAAAWSQVSTAALLFAAPAPTSLSNNPSDGKYVVTIEDTPANRSVVGSALAVTLLQYSDQSGQIADSDIIFNPSVTTNSQFTPFSTDGSPGTYDLQSVLVHEMGHSLGADHSPVISATMFQAMPPCLSSIPVAECTLHQILSADDIAFATDAYPSANAAAQLGSITGTVALSDGTPVRGALVIAVDPAKGTTIGGISSLQDGSFTLRRLPPGSYQVYAQPLNGPVLPGNLGVPGISAANRSFRTTFAGGNSAPLSIAVTAGGSSTAAISVDTLSPNMQIQFFGTGSSGGHQDFSLSGGPVIASSGGSVDLLLWGPGMDASVSASQVHILGPGITLRSGSVRVDSLAAVNGFAPVRLTVDIAPLAAAVPATVYVVNGTDGAAYTGGLVMQPVAPVISVTERVQNGASFVPGQAVAPGSLVSIFGNNFASAPFTAAPGLPLPTQLAGVSVTFNGIPAPVIHVIQNVSGHPAGTDQINVEVPWNVLPAGAPSGNAQVVVTRGGLASAPVTIPITSAAPGLFSLQPDSSGVKRPIAYDANYVWAFPAGAYAGLTSKPIKPGAALVLLATGLGPVTIMPDNGAPSPLNSLTLTNPTVLIGGVPAPVFFSGLLSGFAGVYQVNVTVPPNVPTGNAVSLQIQMNGITTSSQLQIAVSN